VNKNGGGKEENNIVLCLSSLYLKNLKRTVSEDSEVTHYFSMDDEGGMLTLF
jgi:hypothetical protein